MAITTKKIIEVAYGMLDLEPQEMHGCYEELSNEHYHRIKSHLSRSAIMDYDKSPYTYWAKHINPERPIKDATQAMKLGSAFHTMILEPNLFDEIYASCPPKVLLKHVGRDAYLAFKAKMADIENTSKIILTAEEFKVLCDMEIKLLTNKKAVELIQESRIENSFFWRDPHSEMLLKCRPDILHENMIVDLKTCSDASPRAYQKEMVTYGYHVQGAMIRDGVEAIEGRKINTVINICVETKYPYNMGIYIIDEAAIDEGQIKYKNILLEIKHAIKYNEFIDYGVQTISLPKWAI